MIMYKTAVLCVVLAVLAVASLLPGCEAEGDQTTDSGSADASTDNGTITTTTDIPGPAPAPSPTPAGPVCTAVTENPNTPEKPVLPRTWSARIEAKIEWQGDTVQVPYWCDMEQYVDLDVRQKQAYLHTHSEKDEHVIYDYANNKVLKINNKDSECDLSTFARSAFLDLTIDFPKTGGDSSPEAILFFGGGIIEQYVNDTEVRGIPVSHWTACLHCETDSCTETPVRVDYYFSTADYVSPSGLPQVPIKAVFTRDVKDTSSPPVIVRRQNVYDFTQWRSKVEERSDHLFQVPCGVVCPAATSLTVPQLSDFFTLTTEMIFPETAYVFVTNEHHDYDVKMSRYDWTPSSHHASHYGPMYGYGPITVIHDFNNHLEFVLVHHNDTCEIQPLSLEDSLPDVGHQANHSDVIIMRHGKELFGMSDTSLTYQGEKMWRNIGADVWAVKEGEHTTKEFYFAKDDWTSTADLSYQDQTKALIGIAQITDYGGDNVSRVYSHMVDYLDQTGQDTGLYEPFNIRSCFAPDEQVHFRVQVAGSYETLVAGRRRRYITNAVKKTLAQKAIVSEIRITDVYFGVLDEGKLDIWMTLLGAPDVKDASPTAAVYTELDEAYQHLELALGADAEGITLSIPYPGQTKPTLLLIETGSLRNADQKADPRTNTVIKKVGHSGSSMGALGFFMLLLGGVCGVGVGYWQWNRRGRGIPYSVQH